MQSNNPRYQEIADLGVVIDLLRRYGYQPGEVDDFIIDGWYEPEVRKWRGQRLTLDLAPYRRGLPGRDLLRPYQCRTLDLDYTSYTHYAGHVAAAYCSSPFARAGDGPAFPHDCDRRHPGLFAGTGCPARRDRPGPEDLIITLGDDVNRVKCIGTYCSGGGWLTGIEVITGAVWQSNRRGALREERQDS